MKKTTKQPISDEILALRQDANGIAQTLGLTRGRIDQMRREGGLKPDAGGLYGVADALRCHFLFDSPRGAALLARARHINARALELELGTRRTMRRLLTLDEVREFAVLIYEQAVEFVDSESNRVYTENLKSHTDHNARILTGKFYDTLRRIPDAWGAGVIQFCKDIDRDVLPLDSRLVDVLARIIREIESAYAADQKKLATPA
jgi:hypothetical protein